MVKKTPVTPRAPQRLAKTEVVTCVSAEDVRQGAYNRFQARGHEHGHDIEDWLAAESELLKDNKSKSRLALR